MKYFQLLIIILLSYLSQAQMPVLVKDINPGFFPVASSIYGKIQIGDIIYFVGDPGATRVLYAVKNGSVEVISELCTGDCSFFKFPNIEYKNKLYFFRSIKSGPDQLFESDGTSAGTKLVFEYNGSFKSFAIGKNGKLYMTMYNRKTFKDEIFISDGTTAGIKLIGTTSFFDYSEYDNGMVFPKIEGDSLKLYRYDNETLSVMGKVLVKSKSEIRGFYSIVESDLVILLYSDALRSSEIFRYDAASGGVKKELTLPYTQFHNPFLKEYSKDSLVLYHFDGGHFIISGNPLIKSNITPYSKESFRLLSDKYYKNNGQLIYLATPAETPLKSKVVLYDGNIANNVEFNVESSNGILFLGFNQYNFYIDNDSDLKGGLIQIFDMANKSTKIIYNLDQTFSTGGIEPLGVVDGKLYFLANLNQLYGRELYYIETGITTSVDDLIVDNENDLKLVTNANYYSIYTENEHRTLGIKAYDISGQSIYQKQIKSNVEYPLDPCMHGHLVIVVSNNKGKVLRSFNIYLP